jgi:hypothetical protein
VATEKKLKAIRFMVELGPVDQWQDLQRRIAARVVSAYMIAAPRLGSHRRAVGLKLLDGDYSHIKLEAADSTSKKLALTIRQKVKKSSGLIRSYASPRAQRARLYFNPALKALPKSEKGAKKMYGEEIKAVLIAGMMVLTFDWADRLGNPLQLQGVKHFLREKGGAAFWGNEVKFYKSGIDDAWTAKRDAAHLCAALVVFMERQHRLASGESAASRRFTEDEEEKFIAEIGHYLGCGKWFEAVMAKVEERAHETMKVGLRPLPDSINAKAVEYGGTPVVPDRFASAFESWCDSRKS